MPKGKPDHRAARAMLAAPYPLPNITTRKEKTSSPRRSLPRRSPRLASLPPPKRPNHDDPQTLPTVHEEGSQVTDKPLTTPSDVSMSSNVTNHPDHSSGADRAIAIAHQEADEVKPAEFIELQDGIQEGISGEMARLNQIDAIGNHLVGAMVSLAHSTPIYRADMNTAPIPPHAFYIPGTDHHPQLCHSDEPPFKLCDDHTRLVPALHE